MSDSRLEKFIYAICSMDVTDLPVPLSRIEKLWNCLITGETPDFEPLSRNEKYLMAMLDRYDISNLPAPMSRGEKLLYKIAVGETDLSDVPGYLSRYEELLKYLIENGGIGGGDFEYVLYTLNQSLNTLYTTAKKPVKSAILSGNTCYRDIDTGEILESFEEGRNLELVSVKMPVLTTTGKNLLDINKLADINNHTATLTTSTYTKAYPLQLKPNTKYSISRETSDKLSVNLSVITIIDGSENRVNITGIANKVRISTTGDDGVLYLAVQNVNESNLATVINDVGYLQVEEASVATSYEPHKTNILTVNEDIELGSVGNVQDELNLMTGELTQRTEEFILNNSSNVGGYVHGVIPSTHLGFKYSGNFGYDPLSLSSCISNYDLKLLTWSTSRLIYGYINKSLLDSEDLTSLQNFFANNDVMVRWKKSQSTVKTVDLTTVDQDNQPTQLGTFENITHVALESAGLIPEVEMEVATRISKELASASPLMDDISTNQQQLEATVDEQSNNVDATMIATTEIYEETL